MTSTPPEPVSSVLPTAANTRPAYERRRRAELRTLQNFGVALVIIVFLQAATMFFMWRTALTLVSLATPSRGLHTPAFSLSAPETILHGEPASTPVPAPISRPPALQAAITPPPTRTPAQPTVPANRDKSH